MRAFISTTFVAMLVLVGAFLLIDLGGPVGESDAAAAYVPAFSQVQRDKGPVFHQGCLITGSQLKSGRCVYGNPKSRKIVVVFGDSHALQWTPALLRIARQRNWRMIALLRGNCTPALVRIDAQCDRWRQNSLARIRKTKPDLVFLGTNTGKSVVTKHGGQALNRRASGRVLQAGMVTTMRKLLKLGSKVTLMRDLVLAPFTPSDCVQEHPGQPDNCSFKAHRPSWLSFDYKAAHRMGRVQMIDALPEVCASGVCRATSGQILKFRDRAHLSATYVVTLSNWLDRRLQKP